MANLTFADTYNMVAFLSKSNASTGFDQTVDFLNAQVIQYALMVNLTIYVSCIKQFWATVSIKKVNDVIKLQALIDRKKVVVTENIIRQDLRLDDADGVECLPTKEIFAELARMGYEKPPLKLTFYKACSIASAIICLATGRKFNFSKYIFDSMAAAEEEDEEDEVPAAPTPPSPTHEPTPPSQEPITSPPQAQSVAALEQDKVAQALEIYKLKRRVKRLEKKRRLKHSGLKRLRKVGTSQKVESSTETVVDIETEVKLDAELKGRIERKDDDNAAIKEVNAAESTVFDDEEENIDWNVVVEQMQEKHLDNIKKYQSLKRKPIFVAQARKNMIVYLKNMAGYKMEHFRGMTYDQVRPIFEREYNKVRTFLKPDRDEEPTKKRVAKETLLQESFKKLRAEVGVLGSEPTQDTPTDDPKEMSKEDVKNMLEIIQVSEFKVEALQVKYPLIDWEIHFKRSRSYWKIIRVGGITQAYQSFEDMLKDFDREDLYALWRLVKEKFNTVVPTIDKEKALWVKLKRLFKPDADDVIWKLQMYMRYLIMWKLHSNCGVHQVSSTTRRHDLFRLAEKDYPLSNGVMALMPSTKLQNNSAVEETEGITLSCLCC
nr:hypothetical protein [Tanacetum cinerariifolium]